MGERGDSGTRHGLNLNKVRLEKTPMGAHPYQYNNCWGRWSVFSPDVVCVIPELVCLCKGGFLTLL